MQEWARKKVHPARTQRESDLLPSHGCSSGSALGHRHQAVRPADPAVGARDPARPPGHAPPPPPRYRPLQRDCKEPRPRRCPPALTATPPPPQTHSSAAPTGGMHRLRRPSYSPSVVCEPCLALRAGIGHVSIADPDAVSQADLEHGGVFSLSKDNLGSNKAPLHRRLSFLLPAASFLSPALVPSARAHRVCPSTPRPRRR